MKKYCGTDTLPPKLNEFLSYFHNLACKKHDYRYEGLIGRILADIWFLGDMLWAGFKTILFGIAQLLLAPIMFLAVLFFGYKFYNK